MLSGDGRDPPTIFFMSLFLLIFSGNPERATGNGLKEDRLSKNSLGFIYWYYIIN
jgi:hypothetical protein